MSKIWTRMGDGNAVELTPDELRQDIIAASEDAADKGNPALEENEIDKLSTSSRRRSASSAWSPATKCR